jgi:hypothetical protein
MPYKDPEKQREAQSRHYRENKDRYKENQRRNRAKPGYRDAEYAKRKASRPDAAPLEPKICAECGTEFQPRVKHQKYCSAECRPTPEPRSPRPAKPKRQVQQSKPQRRLSPGRAMDIEAAVRRRLERG